MSQHKPAVLAMDQLASAARAGVALALEDRTTSSKMSALGSSIIVIPTTMGYFPTEPYAY